MKITRQNYEAYFIDYLEGSLDEKLVDQFIEFLQENPDLKKELSLFESVSAVPENTTFSKKDKLYKNKFDIETEFNEAAVANLEGDITTKEKREFENYLSSHPEKQNDLKLFSKTLLKADNRITFTNKSKLYKKPKGRVVLFWAGRVAAVLILAFAIFSLLDKNVNPVNNENRVAEVKETKQPEIPQEKTVREFVQEEVQKNEAKEKLATKETTPVQKKEIVAPKQKSPKNIQKKKAEPVQEEKVVPLREPIENLAVIQPILASIDAPQPAVALAPTKLKYIEIIIEEPLPADDERLLADVVKEKTGIDKLSINKIKKAGLNLVSGFTKDNLSYETNANGKITEINYDSRLLAFSIPTHKEEASK